MDHGPFTWLRERHLDTANHVVRAFPGEVCARSPWRIVLAGRVSAWNLELHITARTPGMLTLSAAVPAVLHDAPSTTITAARRGAAAEDAQPTWATWASEVLAEARAARLTTTDGTITVGDIELRLDDQLDPIWLHGRLATWGRLADQLEVRLRAEAEQAARQTRGAAALV